MTKISVIQVPTLAMVNAINGHKLYHELLYQLREKDIDDYIDKNEYKAKNLELKKLKESYFNAMNQLIEEIY